MTALEGYRQQFEVLVPELTKMAARKLLHLPKLDREEHIQNALALAWQSYAGLIEQGRADEPGIIKSVLWYAIKQTRAGRALSRSGNTNAKDAVNAAKAGKVHFEAANLRQFVSDATPVPDQVSFRLDIPAFLDTLTDHQRRMAEDLMAGERTQDVAAKFGVSPGAVSQFRVRFKTLFEEFSAA